MTNRDQNGFYRAICELQSQALKDISRDRPVKESLHFVMNWIEKFGRGRYSVAIHYTDWEKDKLHLGAVRNSENLNRFPFEAVNLQVLKSYALNHKNNAALVHNNNKVNDDYDKFSRFETAIGDTLFWPITSTDNPIGSITLFFVNEGDHRQDDSDLLEKVNDSIAALIQHAHNKAKDLNALNVIKKSVKQAPVVMGLLKGQDLIIEWYNDALEPIWGKGRDVIGKPLIEAQPELINEKFFLDQLLRVYHTGEAYHGTETLSRINIDGKLEDKYFDYVYHPVKGSAGNTEAVLVIAPDVTEKVRGKQKLQVQAALFKEMVMMAPFIMMILRGPEMRVELGNAPLFKYWNKKEEEVIGKPLLQILPELEDQPFANILKSIYRSGESFGEKEVLNFFETPEGRVNKYVSYLYQPLRDYNGNVDGIMVTAEDVTEEVTARQQILLAEERLRLATTAARVGTFDLDIISGVLLWDKRCREVFGINHQRPVTYEHDFQLGLHPDDRDRVFKLVENVYNKKTSNGDYDTEYRTIGQEDGKIRWVRAKGKAFFDHDNKPYRFLGVVIDITDNKLNELRKNDFIAMVSHELKTPLTSVKSYIQMALLEAQKGEITKVTRFMDRANIQAGKMSTMINDFLDLSRLESGHMALKLEQFYIRPLISECIDDIRSISTCNIILEECEDVEVNADREKIGHVLLNLLSNAIKYSPKLSEIRVACKREDSQVTISVIDHGKGIDQKHIPHLFERFYRVENKDYDPNSGFGIGLYLVAEIIKMHQGTIDVMSQIGQGSTFSFSLPLLFEHDG